LALQIARFAETIDSAAAGLKLNLLTDYLYELAGVFMRFYESCPVLAADSPEQRASRLRLCDLTARTLRVGLDLLGIRTLERM
jgi:arginyl-tRNA synthetase